MKTTSQTKSGGGATNGDGNDKVEDGAPDGYFGLPLDADPSPRRLTVSEVSVFGRVGTVESVWGKKLPECGLCKCEGFRHRYRLHGTTCPLHVKSMSWGPTALKSEGAA